MVRGLSREPPAPVLLWVPVCDVPDPFQWTTSTVFRGPGVETASGYSEERDLGGKEGS